MSMFTNLSIIQPFKYDYFHKKGYNIISHILVFKTFNSWAQKRYYWHYRFTVKPLTIEWKLKINGKN